MQYWLLGRTGLKRWLIHDLFISQWLTIGRKVDCLFGVWNPSLEEAYYSFLRLNIVSWGYPFTSQLLTVWSEVDRLFGGWDTWRRLTILVLIHNLVSRGYLFTCQWLTFWGEVDCRFGGWDSSLERAHAPCLHANLVTWRYPFTSQLLTVWGEVDCLFGGWDWSLEETYDSSPQM